MTAIVLVLKVYPAAGVTLTSSTMASVSSFTSPAGSVVFAAVLPGDQLAGINPEYVNAGPGMALIGAYIDMLADEYSISSAPISCPFLFGSATP